MICEQNPSFSKKLPFLQLAWDSTSLGVLKECPYKYFLTMVEGFQPKQVSFHLQFGILYHSCLERYDREKATGVSHSDAMLLATEKALQESGFRNEEGNFIPWQSDIPQKTRFILVRTIVWYLDLFEFDSAKTVILSNGKPAVELAFQMDSGLSHEGDPMPLCGHLDRVTIFNEATWIQDRKTTKITLSSNYFERFSPDNQMSLYALAGQVVFEEPVAGIIIDAAQLAVGFSRFQRGFAPRTRDQLEEWMDDTRFWIQQAVVYAEKKTWPMNDKSCHNYGGCKFRSICQKDPKVRPAFLEGNFTRQMWNPLQSRGD